MPASWKTPTCSWTASNGSISAWPANERIAEYVSARNPAAALRLIAQFRRRFREIRQHPHACPLVTRYEMRQMRRKLHRNYLIFYRYFDETIEIVHVIHGAMDYEAILDASDNGS